MTDWTHDIDGRLADAVHLLQEEPEISAPWRDALRRELEQVDQATEWRRANSHRWHVHPMAAIAAGIICVLLGGTSVYVALRLHQSPTAPIGIEAAAPSSPQMKLPVRFALVAPNAAHVYIAGDFNQWSPAALPMRRMPDGKTWVVDVQLVPGRYAYSFVVDGRLAQDPTAPAAGSDDFGVPSSVILVKGL